MFEIKPTPETEKLLTFLTKEAPERIKKLEYIVAAHIGAYALAAIKAGTPDAPAYIKAYKDSLHLVQIAVQDYGAAAIVGVLRVDWNSADVMTTLVVFKPAGSGSDPAAAILADPRFQPWAIDALPPVSVDRPVMLRLRDRNEVQLRRAANLSYRNVIDAELNRRGVKFDRTFKPDGGAFLDTQDLALQLEHGGMGFPNMPHWRSVVSALKNPRYVRDKVFKDYMDVIVKSLTDPSFTGLEGITPRVQGSLSIAQISELDKRPGNGPSFGEIVGGYSLFD